MRLQLGFGDSLSLELPACVPRAAVDSLIFGTISFSDVSGDASGNQIIFERRGRWLRGASIRAAGGIGALTSLRGLAHGSDPGELRFWVSSGNRTVYPHVMTITCDSLFGTFQFRNFADAQYDDGASLGEPIRLVMRRTDRLITKFP